MSTVPARRKKQAVLPLRDGERLTQPEFHRRYEACPDGVKAELIGGTVYMASPLGRPHGQYHKELGGALWMYKSRTPGVEVLDNATTILGEESEPQPDLELRILTEYGGKSEETENEYIKGPPELVVEVANSTRDVALKGKRADYDKAGVEEYLVLCVGDREIHWFSFASGKPIKPNRQGVYRSRVFPGLWIDGPALLARDSLRIMEVVQQGLASRPHAAFVKRLQAEHRRRAGH
jgi:Uma2 family endonuclease